MKGHRYARMFPAALLMSFALQDANAGERGSNWSAPVSLGTPPNSEFADICPSISRDGSSLYFFSDRPGGFGGNDLYVSHRDRKTGQWGAAENLGPLLNTPYDDSSAWLTYGGHALYFSSDRPDGQGGLDVWVSWRRDVHDDFGWEAPVNLTGVNDVTNDFSPVAHKDRESGAFTLYFASDRPGGPGLDDIYVSRFDWKAGQFGPATLVAELSTSAVDRLPSVTADGREMIITSNRPGTFGALDLWSSRRLHGSASAWSEPVNLGPDVNSVERDGCGRVTGDGRTLYLHSTRNGGFPMFDLFVSKR